MKLSLAFSPCPNDCFMFDAIVNRRIDLEGLEFAVTLADIEALNHAAFAGEPDVSKLSFHAYAYCADRYVLLDAGSALGRNCGPLLISKRPIGREEVEGGQVSIAIPGKYTTANFLCGLAFPAAQNKTEVLFSDIEPALLDGRFDAGVIIHENRFTYQAKGLRKIIDLGEFWETETGAPIPLGGIVVKRSLPDDVKQAVNRVMRRSVEYAFAHREASLPYVRAHAQEMSEEVMYQHIDLYVNELSVDLGTREGGRCRCLFDRARHAGIVPAVEATCFSMRKPSRRCAASRHRGGPAEHLAIDASWPRVCCYVSGGHSAEEKIDAEDCHGHRRAGLGALAVVVLLGWWAAFTPAVAQTQQTKQVMRQIAGSLAAAADGAGSRATGRRVGSRSPGPG